MAKPTPTQDNSAEEGQTDRHPCFGPVDHSDRHLPFFLLKSPLILPSRPRSCSAILPCSSNKLMGKFNVQFAVNYQNWNECFLSSHVLMNYIFIPPRDRRFQPVLWCLDSNILRYKFLHIWTEVTLGNMMLPEYVSSQYDSINSNVIWNYWKLSIINVAGGVLAPYVIHEYKFGGGN